MRPSLRTSCYGLIESTSNVEQPVFQSLTDLRQPMDSLSESSQGTTCVRRVPKALHMLELEPSRDVRKQLQPLLQSWGIKQTDSLNEKKSACGVRQCMVAQILAARNKLRTLSAISVQTSFRNLFRGSAEQFVRKLNFRSRSRSPFSARC